jgi:hypothetical protein
MQKYSRCVNSAGRREQHYCRGNTFRDCLYAFSRSLFLLSSNQRRSTPCHCIPAIEQIPWTRQDKLSNPKRLSPCYTRTPNTHN